MKRCNFLMYKALGGGNFAQAKLAQYHHVLIRRRILSYFYMIIVAFLCFLPPPVLATMKQKNQRFFITKPHF